MHGKRSEKLTQDEGQLAFEDLETAIAEVEPPKEQTAPPISTPRQTRQRSLGHLSAGLPRIERALELAGFDWSP